MLDTIDSLYQKYNVLIDENEYSIKYDIPHAHMFVIEGIEKVKDVIEKNRKRKLTKHKKLSNNTIIEIDNCSPLEIVKLYFSWCNHIITSFFSSFADTEPFLTQLCPVKFILYILTGCKIIILTSFPSTNLKKLTEEIEADIIHYKADYIFFYIYDKEKIIKDRHAFETNFNRSFDGKEVRIIILQPVNM